METGIIFVELVLACSLQMGLGWARTSAIKCSKKITPSGGATKGASTPNTVAPAAPTGACDKGCWVTIFQGDLE